MWQRLQKAWTIPEIRNNLLFVLGLLVVYRVAAHIPMPGMNAAAIQNTLAGNQFLGLLNLFSGGTLDKLSIIMLGLGPYITASIILQLLTMIVPSLEELSKEGESGQQKINMYTRWLTIPLALIQGYGMLRLLSQQAGTTVLRDATLLTTLTVIFTISAGTMFLMWLGELISEKKVGNGVSLLIFAGIVSSLTGQAQTALLNYDSSSTYTYVLFLAAAALTIVGVVFVNEGQRNIPVTYAKQVRGPRTFGGSTTHLPFRVNMAGVIPIIFAISLILFPSAIAQFFVNAKSAWLAHLALGIIRLFQNQLFYAVLYFVLVVGFTYFYTSIIFQPHKIAENLQKQGGFIPGVRPGRETESYLGKVMNRLNLTGALFLGAIALLPLIVQAIVGSRSLSIGGTSILIVVAVAIETAKQIEAQITVHEYEWV